MSIGDLLARTETCAWFAALGHPVSSSYLSIPDQSAWASLVNHGVSAEFGLHAERSTSAPPAAIIFLDPSDPPARSDVAPSILADEVRRTQQQLYRTVLAGTRDLPPSSWFVVGPTDMRPAAVRAAAHTARHAAYEHLTQITGPWTERFELFLAGHWPFGIAPDGRLAVL
jgi:hypothetical protein